VGNARARRFPAKLVEDEDYQLRYERVAGIDVAKAKADVCSPLNLTCPRMVADSPGQCAFNSRV
jgi:hypothetical protein